MCTSQEYGTPEELAVTLDWLASLPHKHKVLIAGNVRRRCAPISPENAGWATSDHFDKTNVTDLPTILPRYHH